MEETNIKSNYAEQIGIYLAQKLKDPEEVKYLATKDKNCTMAGVHPWSDTSLSTGYPGLIILFSTLEKKYPHENWDRISHQYILKLKDSLETEGYKSASLFGGLAGIAYSLLSASLEETRYKNFLETVNQLLIEETEIYMKSVQNIINEQKGTSCLFYDVIGGLVGIGRYFLETSYKLRNRQLLLDILKTLYSITKPIIAHDCKVPGWFVPKEYQFNEKYQRKFPKGNLNIGISHGIAGILALFSQCIDKGIKDNFILNKTNELIDWIVSYKQENEHGIYWPGIISFEEFTSDHLGKVAIRDTWCYGVPGIARTLYLAGKSTERLNIIQLSCDAFHSIYKDREIEQRNLSGSSICHGTAGLMRLTKKMAFDTKSDYLFIKGELIFQKLYSQFDSNFPFGYIDVESNLKINKPGLLEGSAGISLSLLSKDEEKDLLWDQLFLIS